MPWSGAGLTKPIAELSDAEFDLLIALMRSDPSVGNEIGFSLSGADWTSLNARLSARRGPVAETEMESVAGAFLTELAWGAADTGLEFVPGVGAAKNASELFTGKNIRGEDIGIFGRIMAGVGLIPVAGGVIKKMAGLGDAARGLAKGAGALDDVADASRRIDNTVMEAPKIASTGDAVGDVLDPVTGALRVLQKECFVAGTLVATESGPKRIELVQAGDRVWSFDLHRNQWRLCRVAETFAVEHLGEIYAVTAGDQTVESSYHHPYWVVEGRNLADRPAPEHVQAANDEGGVFPGRWVDAGDLEVGDVLLLRAGRRVPVTEITVRTSAETIYNFAVDDLHNYAVGPDGALVHNNCRIRNLHLAGKTHPVTGIPFDANGFPDFSSVSKAEVAIHFSGDRSTDFRLANKLAGFSKTPEGYTWHHHQDGSTMQLVPFDIHSRTGHTGGFSFW